MSRQECTTQLWRGAQRGREEASAHSGGVRELVIERLGSAE
jgi:hypothetical protein